MALPVPGGEEDVEGGEEPVVAAGPQVLVEAEELDAGAVEELQVALEAHGQGMLAAEGQADHRGHVRLPEVVRREPGDGRRHADDDITYP